MTIVPPEGIVRRIYANLARLIGGKAGAGVISLGYRIIAARALGPADYGVLMLVHTFAMTVGGIVEFPGWHAIVRYGAEALAAKDHGRLGRLLRFAGAVELTGGATAVATAAVLGPLVGARLGWSPVAVGFAVPYSLAVLIGGPAYAGAAGLLVWLTLARAIMLAGPPASAALVALGRPSLSVVANLGSAFATMPLLLVLLRGFGIVGAGWQAMVQAALAASLLLFFVWRESRRQEGVA